MPQTQPPPKPTTFAVVNFVVVFAIFCLHFGHNANAQWYKRFGRPAADPIPVAFNGLPNQQQLLQRLAAQTAMVKQVDASVSVALKGAPKLKGTIQIERPLRLRLKAGVLGVDQMGVDVGSNDDLFWIWTRVPIPGQSPTLMYAFHEQFKRSSGAVRQAIPLEPSWLISALGLVEFSNEDFHEGPTPNAQGRLQLVTVSNANSGRQYRVTLIDAIHGLIEQQSIYDENRNLIAYTNSTDYRFYPKHNISLPNKIEMHLYTADGQEQELAVTTNGFNINSLFGDPQRMWTMPQPANVQKIDLSQIGGQPPRGVQPARSAPRPPTTMPQSPTSPPAQPTYRSTPTQPASSTLNLRSQSTSGDWQTGSTMPNPSGSAPDLNAPQIRTRLSPLN